MKKSSSLVLIIPFTVAVLAVIGVFVWHYVAPVPASQPRALPQTTVTIPPIEGSLGKPTVGFGQLQSENPVGDLRLQFDAIAVSGGVASISALEQQASSL